MSHEFDHSNLIMKISPAVIIPRDQSCRQPSHLSSQLLICLATESSDLVKYIISFKLDLKDKKALISCIPYNRKARVF